ncbi:MULTISPECIES: MFS transporter [unclassified Streptomyces]|uniref:MFS transporter n=1 Tax=unclassified Streptomyces TaxID=2593676 RepID=UPI0033BB8493
MTRTRTLPPPSARPGTRATPVAAVIISVALVELSSGITQGFLSPVLRGLADTLHVTAADLNWISIANLMASVAFTPVLSRMGDLHGHRRVLRWNLAIVLLGSVLVGLSRSFEVLLAGQILQGAFAGFFPLLVGVLRNRGGAAESRRGISLMVAALVGGIAVGLVSSGLIARSADNPTAALWVPTAAVGLALAITWPLLPESDRQPGGRVDWAGGVLLSVGLVALMLGLGMGGAPGWAWSAPRTLACLIGGVLVTAVWVYVELRVPEPVIAVRMFRHRNVVVTSLVTLTFTFCMLGLQVANPVFMGTDRPSSGYGLGLDAFGIALAMLPNLLAVALGSLLAPAVAARITDRLTMVAASLLMAVGYVATVVFHSSPVPFLAASAVAGLGIGFLQHSTRTLAVESVPHDRTSEGSGINELLINVGGSIGAAVVLAVFAARTPAGEVLPRLGAYTTAWTVCAVVSVAGAAIALLYKDTKKEQS